MDEQNGSQEVAEAENEQQQNDPTKLLDMHGEASAQATAGLFQVNDAEGTFHGLCYDCCPHGRNQSIPQ